MHHRNTGFALLEMLFVAVLLTALMVLFLNFLRNQQVASVDQVAAQQLARLMDHIIIPVEQNGNHCLAGNSHHIPDCVPSINKAELDQLAKLGFDIYVSNVDIDQSNHLNLVLVKHYDVINNKPVAYLSDFRIQRIFHQSLAGLSPETLSCLDTQNGSPFSYTISNSTFYFTVRPGC